MHSQICECIHRSVDASVDAFACKYAITIKSVTAANDHDDESRRTLYACIHRSVNFIETQLERGIFGLVNAWTGS